MRENTCARLCKRRRRPILKGTAVYEIYPRVCAFVCHRVARPAHCGKRGKQAMIMHQVTINNMTLDIFDLRFDRYRADAIFQSLEGKKDALVGARMTVSERAAQRTYLFFYPKHKEPVGAIDVEQVTPTMVTVSIRAWPWAAEHWAPRLIIWLDGQAAKAEKGPGNTDHATVDALVADISVIPRRTMRRAASSKPEAALAPLPPRPGENGATWNDTFDWYYKTPRASCRDLKHLAALIIMSEGTVRNEHSKYQQTR